MIIAGVHDSVLVVLSVTIAVFASYTALDLVGRVRASTGWGRQVWLAASAVAMGGGIWSMHFVAMLAFSMPGMDVSYDLGLTALSLVVAIAATGVGFAVISRGPGSWTRLAGAGLFTGVGVVAMHYMGMAAMRMRADVSYDATWVSISVLVAIGAATAALWLASRNSRQPERWAAAGVMGAAVAGMHYAGMRAALFTAHTGHAPGLGTSSLGQTNLALAVTGATFFLLFLSLVAAMFDRRFAHLAQREAEALRQSEIRFRALYRGAPLPLFALNASGHIGQVSDAWLDLLGYGREDVEGRPLEAFLAEGSALAFRTDDLPALLAGETPPARERQMVTRSGDLRDVVMAARLDRDPDGSLLILGGVTDITQRKAAEDALRQAQKIEALGQLTGGVAHDFNNLLAVVIGNLDLLKRRLPDDAKLRSLTDNAAEGARRGAALTKRLLSFARRQDLKLEAVDVAGLVNGMTDLLQRTLGPQTRVETRFPAALPRARADSHQLELTLLNLAVNARDAMPQGGRIEISARPHTAGVGNPEDLAPGRYLLISMADEGSGMDEATLRRSAEPFFTTKGDGRGTGLGLSMAHAFASQSGGRLSLSSRLGEGTTVDLYLPADHEAATERGPSRAAPAMPPAPFVRGRKVLAVDDDALVLMNTEAMLEELGAQVLTAAGGAEALAVLQGADDLDLLVTDQLMPGMTGTELIARAKALRPKLPVLIVTGFAKFAPGELDGAVLLRKPFTQAELASALAKVASPAPCDMA